MHILTVTDIMSKYAWIIFLKGKPDSEIAMAILFQVAKQVEWSRCLGIVKMQMLCMMIRQNFLHKV